MNYCFHAKIDKGDNLSSAWHYHPEIELVLIKKSGGTRIVGTSVETFGDNDLVLIGKNVPHAFLHEEKYLAGHNPATEALVLQFRENFLGDEFWNVQETKVILHLLIKARQGLSVTDSGKKEIIPLMEKIFRASSLDRVMLLLEILKLLAREDFHQVLVNDGLHSSARINDERFNKILEYTYANYDEHICIDDVAKIANLTRESFCRYFKVHARKTYMDFLTEFRIKRACQMIRDENKAVKEIGYSCGFDSLSNFYYQFKKITKLSPLHFKQCGILVA